MTTGTGEATRYRVGLLAAALILGGMALPMFQGRVYPYGDLSAFHLPVREFYARCLAEGDDFSWFPAFHAGFYLQGEGQAGMFHPLHLLLYRALPLGLAFNLDLLSSYVFLLAGTALLLRRWGLGRDACVFGGIIFTFGGFNLLHFMHLNVVNAAAHMPWMLLAIDAMLRAGGPRGAMRAGAALALLTTSQLLLGQPQLIWYSGLVEVGYVGLLSLGCRMRPSRLAVLAFFKLLGVVGAAVQLLPTYDLMLTSNREKPTPEFLAMGSLPPANLTQMIAPYLYKSRVIAPPAMVIDHMVGPATAMNDWRTHEFGFYNGAIVPVLLIWALLRWRRLGPALRLAVGSLVLAALAMLLAFGDYTPLFRVTSRLPVFNLFRVSARCVVFYDLATAAIAAIAFADLAGLFRRGERVAWRSLGPLALAPAIACGVALGTKLLARRWPEFLMQPYLGSDLEVIAGVALVGLATLLVALAARGSRHALTAVILFTAADLSAFGLTFMRQDPPREISSFAADVKLPPGHESVRMFARGQDNRPTIFGARMVDGYTSFFPRLGLDYTKAASLRVAGVGWMLKERGDYEWVRLPDPMPRARLVAKAQPSVDTKSDIDRIDVADTALVDRPVALGGGPAGLSKIVHDRPGRINVATTAPTRQLLVLAERYHSGWIARIDGRDVRPIKAYGEFLACAVEPGEHRVQFLFKPESLRLGKIVSGAGLGLMLASLILARFLPAGRGVNPSRAGIKGDIPGLARRSRRRAERATVARER